MILFTGGMHGEGGCAWQRRGCVTKGDVHGEGGVHGKRRACMVKGHAW